MKYFHPREGGVPPTPPQLCARHARTQEGGIPPAPPQREFHRPVTKEAKQEITHSTYNLHKTPPVGAKPSPDGARRKVLVADKQKLRPRLYAQRPSHQSHKQARSHLTKKNMLTPTPYRTVSLRREPYRTVSKNATAPHDAVVAPPLLITTPHGVGFRREAHTKQNLT